MLFIERPEFALVRAINQVNQLDPPLLVEDLSFGLPEIHLEPTTNTRIGLTVVNVGTYKGSDVHYYNRVRLADYFAGCRIPGNPGDYPNTRAAVVAMYAHYHLPLDPDDLVNSTIAPDATTVVLSPRNGSLMFVPVQTVTLPIGL